MSAESSCNKQPRATLNALEQMLSDSVDVNSQDEYGDNTLIGAAFLRKWRTGPDFYCPKGADVHICDQDGSPHCFGRCSLATWS